MGNKKVIQHLADLHDRKVIIYGAGSMGRHITKFITAKNVGAKVFAFCDTYKTGVDRNTMLEIMAPNELINHKDAVIIIGVYDYLRREDADTIEKHLNEMGFPAEQVLRYSQFIALFEGLDDSEFDWQKFSDDLYDFNTNILMIEEMSRFIDADDRSVVDLGAGSMNLKKFLAPEVEYYPVDFKRRCPETIVCDFNKDEFPDVHADVYFLCAMLYYINDPVSLLEKAASFAERKIMIGLHSENMVNHKEVMHISGFKSYIYVDEISDCLVRFGFLLKDNIVIESVARRILVFVKQGVSS